MTTAEEIFARFNPGSPPTQQWKLKDGTRLADACRQAGGVFRESNLGVRWTFPDDSAIVESDTAYDVGYPGLDDCFCWVSDKEHRPVCPHASVLSQLAAMQNVLTNGLHHQLLALLESHPTKEQLCALVLVIQYSEFREPDFADELSELLTLSREALRDLVLGGGLSHTPKA